MSKRLSELYGLAIYSTAGEYVGKVEDILLNLEEGFIMSMYLKPLRSGASIDGEELKRMLREDGITYEGVTSVGDIILTTKGKTSSKEHKRRSVSESEESDTDAMGEE